jgi:hypothetical protein
MWFSFNCSPNERFILRPFIGGVNGISGEAMIGDMTSLIRRMNSLSPKQDYLVLPEQPWLDGIATSPGLVKQFIATPILSATQQSTGETLRNREALCSKREPSSKGDPASLPVGASVELQVTGKDAVGGFQLEIIPAFDTSQISFSNTSDICFQGLVHKSYLNFIPGAVKRLEPLKSPFEQGLIVGDLVYMKDMRAAQRDRVKTLEDLWNEAPTSQFGLESLRLEVDSMPSLTLNLTIFFQIPSHQPLHITVSVSPRSWCRGVNGFFFQGRFGR